MIISPVASRRRQRVAQRSRASWREMLASSGEIADPCPVPLVTDRYDPVFEDARLQPFLDQADDASVADPMLQEADQPFLTDLVEERSDVGVQYVAHLPAVDPDAKRIQRIMRAASWSEPIREPEEVFLVDRVQQRNHRPLDNLVLQGSDCQRAAPAVRL